MEQRKFTAKKKYGKHLIVLDRPNPNDGMIDGPVLEKKYASFIGKNSIYFQKRNKTTFKVTPDKKGKGPPRPAASYGIFTGRYGRKCR